MARKTYIISPLKAIVSATTSIVSIVLMCTFLYLSATIPALVFLAIALLFAIIAINSAAKLSIDEEGVFKKTLFRKDRSLRWDEIQEVGIAGSKLFPKSDKGKPGQLYIYFSKTHLTDQERFDMMLKWPPRDKLFMQYTDKRAENILLLWEKPFVEYNTREEQIIK